MVEASLHALYEVIERDAISRLSINGRLNLNDSCQIVDLEHMADKTIRSLVAKLHQADLSLLLIRVKGCTPIYTFWAILLDRNPISMASLVRVGYGAHLSPAVAAIRAITEAAQSRLTFIHGAREDLVTNESYRLGNRSQALYTYFITLKPDTSWDTFDDLSNNDLVDDYTRVLDDLMRGGYGDIYRVDLSRTPFHIPIVKVFVCGMAFIHQYS